MRLLLDLGNSRLKWAQWDGNRLGPMTALAMVSGEPLPPLPGADEAWIASVTGAERLAQVERALAEAGVGRVHRVGPPVSTPELRLAYADAASFGVDRWLALRAARAQLAGALLVASCGSALTVDALAADGRHLGGSIAPSPEGMRAALFSRAPHLAGGSGTLRELAGSTADAVHSGPLLAAAALIERLHAATLRELGEAPGLILTGGGAPALRPALRLPARLAPALVLEGLAGLAVEANG